MFDFTTVSLRLSDKDILKKVSSYDIFKYYIHNFKRVGDSFCSELRKDNNPSCTIYRADNGEFKYKDFASGDNHSCFNYVMVKFNCTYGESLRIIANDFNLFKSKAPGVIVANDVLPKLPEHSYKKEKSIITPYYRNWNLYDFTYWNRYSITLSLLDDYQIKPCDFVLVGEGRLNNHKDNPVYVYDFDGEYKIYRPLEKVRSKRWFSNTTRNTIQGYKQLDDRADTLVITKSLKDVICFKLLGYNSIAFSSESTIPDDSVFSELESRFKKIVLFYDRDEIGTKFCKKISDKCGYPYFFIEEAKDLSDYIELKGLEKSKLLINKMIN